MEAFILIFSIEYNHFWEIFDLKQKWVQKNEEAAQRLLQPPNPKNWKSKKTFSFLIKFLNSFIPKKKKKREETENSKTITNVTPLDLPEYLKCPICKEMLINPEMFSCGHTICSICTESRPTSLCPVCKVPTYSHNRIPNYIVKVFFFFNFRVF